MNKIRVDPDFTASNLKNNDNCAICHNPGHEYYIYNSGKDSIGAAHERCLHESPFIVRIESKYYFNEKAQTAYFELYNKTIMKEIRQQANKNAEELENYVI